MKKKLSDQAWYKKRLKTISPRKSGTRICRICKKKKSILKFQVNFTHFSGRKSECNSCAYKASKKGRNYWLSSRIRCANARSLKKISRKDILWILKQQNGNCKYCEIPLTKQNLHIDHTVPLSRGGENILSNISCTCESCNRLKWTMTGKEFISFLKQYIVRFKTNTFS